MPLCHEKKIVLIHIPKSGGTTFEKLISDNTSAGWDFFGKYTKDRYPFFLKRYGIDINKLSLVNPDRSIYDNNYKERALHHLTFQDIARAYDISDLLRKKYKFFSVLRCPFDRLVSMYEYGINKNLMRTEGKTFREWFYDRPVSCQSAQFLVDENGNIPDFINIIDFNHFGDAIQSLFETLDIPSSYVLPHSKKSSRRAIHEYYDSGMLDALRQECMSDFSLMRHLGFRVSL